MRDDLTDGVAIRRRVATWRWVASVVVAAALLVASVVLVIRFGESRSRTTVIVLGIASGLAMCAVAVTWLESRRIARHLHRTIDRLIDTESELRLLLDDLPEAVLSIDEMGIVRGANTKAEELTGLDHSDITGQLLRTLVDDDDEALIDTWLAEGRRRQSVEAITLRLTAPDGTVTVVEASHDLPRSTVRPEMPRPASAHRSAARPSVRSGSGLSSRHAGGSSRRSIRPPRAWR
jgi:PAS domain S-box-containing protein